MDATSSDTNNETSTVSETQPTFSEEQENGSERERNHSEINGNVPKISERTLDHTLTIHEVAKDFEEHGLYLTERTVLNWCHPNKKGITRLDCYYEPREERYFITPTGMETAFQEELKKRSLHTDFTTNNFRKIVDASETQPTFSEEQENGSERERNHSESSEQKREHTGYRVVGDITTDLRSHAENAKRIKELEQEVLDLKITNKGKDYFIDQLKQDREAVVQERVQLIGQLTASMREIGVLETKLLQLEAPKERVIDTEEGSMEGAQDYAR